MIPSFAFAAPEMLHDVEYGVAGSASLRFDGEIPPGEGPFPAAILVHGGGWIAGDRHSTLQPLFRPLADAGFAWFSIDYRLASDITNFGVAIDDVKTAVAFIRAHAGEYRIDPERIVLIGESAGGHLAEMAALTATSSTAVCAVVGFYAPSDLPELARTSRAIPENIRRAMGSKFSPFIVAALKHLSPIDHISGATPPMLLIHGAADALVPPEQSERMCEAVRSAGGSCDLFEVKGAGHGLRWWGSRETSAYQRYLIHWLTRTVGAAKNAA